MCKGAVTTTRLTRDKSATVNPAVTWTPITPDSKPHAGARVLLINREAGVAQIAPFKDDGWYTHFAGLPVFGGEV
jgi:hypothetical protein